MNNEKFRVIYVSTLNDDVDGLCRTLKSQYYKNGIRNLEECGEHGGKHCCTWAIVYVEYGDDF